MNTTSCVPRMFCLHFDLHINISDVKYHLGLKKEGKCVNLRTAMPINKTLVWGENVPLLQNSIFRVHIEFV